MSGLNPDPGDKLMIIEENLSFGEGAMAQSACELAPPAGCGHFDFCDRAE